MQQECLTRLFSVYTLVSLTSRKRWPDSLLEASIRRVGALTPRLIYNGKTLDGARRFRIAHSVGATIWTVELESEREAATALFALEPARAVSLFGKLGINSFALMIGVPLGQLAPYYPRKQAPRSSKSSRRLKKIENYLQQVSEGVQPLDAEYLQKVIQR